MGMVGMGRSRWARRRAGVVDAKNLAPTPSRSNTLPGDVGVSLVSRLSSRQRPGCALLHFLDWRRDRRRLPPRPRFQRDSGVPGDGPGEWTGLTSAQCRDSNIYTKALSIMNIV